MDIKEKIENLIKDIFISWGEEDIAKLVSLERPKDFNNGDYSFSVIRVIQTHKATQRKLEREYPNALKANATPLDAPIDAGNKIKSILEKNLPKEIEKVEVAGAGFINLYWSRDFFVDSIKEIIKKGDDWGKNQIRNGEKIMVEYTDPNPFKPFHIGHLMTNAIGESVARIMEYSSADVVRANYQGDVGPHVAKAIWGIINSGENYEDKGALWIGECYSKGSNAYDEDEKSKVEIEDINKKIYDRSDTKINQIYDWGRKVTLEAFENIYEILGTKFKHYFFESVMAPLGEKTVRNNLGKVFEESDGAIVFKGEKYDPKLHTRVFINSKGLPTYETKEIGLTETKFEKENPNLSIVVTAIEQGEYMKVVQKALSLIHPDYEKRMRHITHGMMKFKEGKMSSRKGNVITGESLLRDSMSVIEDKVKDRVMTEEEKKTISRQVGVSAVKYSILRSAITGDIIYDFDKSISFEGDSGPYLQYTAVRAHGVLKKAQQEGVCEGYKDIPVDVKDLERLLYQFKEVVARAHETLLPHHITTYLTELASSFNAFYGVSQVVNKSDPYSPYLVAITKAFYITMKNGLYLLGIETPEKM